MKRLLAEYLRNILTEESKPIEKGEGIPPEAVGKYRGKFGNVYADPQLTQYLGKIEKGRWIPAAQAPEKKKPAGEKSKDTPAAVTAAEKQAQVVNAKVDNITMRTSEPNADENLFGYVEGEDTNELLRQLNTLKTLAIDPNLSDEQRKNANQLLAAFTKTFELYKTYKTSEDLAEREEALNNIKVLLEELQDKYDFDPSMQTSMFEGVEDFLGGQDSELVKQLQGVFEEAGIEPSTRIDRTGFDTKNPQYTDSPDGPTQQQMMEGLDRGDLTEIKQYQDGVEEQRRAGVAGMGGPVPSEGESLYCQAYDELASGWFEENSDELDRIVATRPKKRLTQREKQAAEALGMDPDSPEFERVIVATALYCKQKLAVVKADKNSVLYKKGKKGFGDAKPSPEAAYCSWAETGFLGAISAQQRLKESSIDTTQDHRIVQSTRELDDSVQAHLENGIANASTGEEKEHYVRELRRFKQFRTYHDTYAIGFDENSRTVVVNISNKKDSELRDPQANTTPAQRLRSMLRDFGPEVAESVATTMQSAVENVSNAAATTVRSQTEMQITDEIVEACERPVMSKYMGQLDAVASNPKHRFFKFLEAGGLDWNSLSTKERLEISQEYARTRLYDENGKSRLVARTETDENGEEVDVLYYMEDDGKERGPIKNLGQIGLPYEPFGKIAIKLGEFGVNEETIKIKQDEKDSVTAAHTEVVDSIHEADLAEGGYHPTQNPDADNGKHAQAFISGVMSAMHMGTYIDADDYDDRNMLLQMGVNAVRPSMIRNCLAEQSGYEGDLDTPEGRKGLKEHLRKRCRVTPGGEKVSVTRDGQDVELFNDQWRTSGTGQKVASYFGKEMRDCLKEKAKLN